jgi:hypothetical protein
VNVIAHVAIEAVDPARRDRVMGRILSESSLSVSLAPRPIARTPASFRSIAEPHASSGALIHAT